jgi:hypothetical protein
VDKDAPIADFEPIAQKILVFRIRAMDLSEDKKSRGIL